MVLPVVWAFNQFGWTTASQAFFWVGPFLIYVLLPALDIKFGRDGQNPPDEVMEYLENDKYYRYCTYIFIPFQFATVLFGAYAFTATDLSWLGYEGGLSWVAKIGLALSVGVLGGTGINTAHEMGHKKESLERWMSKIGWRRPATATSTSSTTAATTCASPPRRTRRLRASARPSGSSCRAASWGSARSALDWRPPVSAGGQEPVGRTWLGNDVLNAWLMSVVFWGVLIAVFGPGADPVRDHPGGVRLLDAGVGQLPRALRSAAAEERGWPLRALHPAAQLELRSPGDQPVPLPPAAAQRPPRQPDASLPDAARMDGAPELPSGYATLIGVTYFPWIWRRMMDHRVLDHYNGDITR